VCAQLDCQAAFQAARKDGVRLVHNWIASVLCTSQGRAEMLVHDWIAAHPDRRLNGRANTQRLFPKQGSQRDKKLFSNTIFVRLERDILIPMPDDLSCA
jgi:hypothetical protein